MPGLAGLYHPLPVTFHSRKSNTRLLSLRVATLQTDHRKDGIRHSDSPQPHQLCRCHVLSMAPKGGPRTHHGSYFNIFLKGS